MPTRRATAAIDRRSGAAGSPSIGGYLFVTVGDRQWPSAGDLTAHPAQDLSKHNGKTVQLPTMAGSRGTIRSSAGRVRPEIWTYGHRNAQGLAVHPETGDVWLNEHGPQGGDELDLVRPGLNYGWPVIGFGVNYRTAQRFTKDAQGRDGAAAACGCRRLG